MMACCNVLYRLGFIPQQKHESRTPGKSPNAQPLLLQPSSMSTCQSAFPLASAPFKGALSSFMPIVSSRRKCPPRVRRKRPRNHVQAPSTRPRIQPMVRKGCSEKVMRMSKKIFSMLEMVSLGLILGGEAVTLLIVSEMEVRDGRIGLPEIVWSQYCRFYKVSIQIKYSGMDVLHLHR